MLYHFLELRYVQHQHSSEEAFCVFGRKLPKKSSGFYLEEAFQFARKAALQVHPRKAFQNLICTVAE